MEYYAKSITQTLSDLQSSRTEGLDTKEVQVRLQKFGPNTFPSTRKAASPAGIFLSQWKSPLIIVLLVAGIASGILGERIDMMIILITASLNALIGFVQEYKANQALEKLSSLTTYNALVLRNGKKHLISSEELVPGDIVFLVAGDRIQADGRLVSVRQFVVEEAPLTGESEPIEKNTDAMGEPLPLGDRKNMAYRGTSVVDGEAQMVVTATGGETELGRIASLVQETADDRTPLQVQLAVLAKQITWIVIGIAIVILLVGTFLSRQTYTFIELFQTAVAVAVAAIPEGLVISLTVILAIGMQFILKRNALVRKLVAAETLGSVNVICTDKTGTLTEGRMRIHSVHTLGGAALEQKARRIGMLANDASKIIDEQSGEERLIGDTTDIAFLYDEATLCPNKIASLPFSSTYKFMAAVCEEDGKQKLFVKGAPDMLLARATYVAVEQGREELDEKKKTDLLQLLEKLAGDGFRTIGVAERELTGESYTELHEEDIQGITFVGIVAITDPLRPAVAETIALSKKAGIRVIIITGDHQKTASRIAEELGLKVKSAEVFDGAALETMSDKTLAKEVKKASIFARVNPSDKIRIVRALQSGGAVVAMTGDGINDAPALKGADIGVAVGSGTDVAKETADMVILDDSFSTIVAAVEQGRVIYENIKKVVVYLLGGSFAEVILILGSMFAGLPVAALPAQILWINLIEDTFPTMALAFEKPDPDIMRESPRPRSARLFDKEMKTIIVLKSILSNVLLFSIFYVMFRTTGDIALTRTIVFVGFATDALFSIFSIRNLRAHIWQYSPLSNGYLLLAVAFGWIMLLLAVYTPGLQLLLRTVPLHSEHWILLIIFGISNIVLLEVIKAYFISKKKPV